MRAPLGARRFARWGGGGGSNRRLRHPRVMMAVAFAQAHREETSHSPVECTTLLRWSPRKGTRGSNPLVSARFKPHVARNSGAGGAFALVS